MTKYEVEVSFPIKRKNEKYVIYQTKSVSQSWPLTAVHTVKTYSIYLYMYIYVKKLFLVVMTAVKDTKSVSFLKLEPFIPTGSTNDFLLFDPFIVSVFV